MLDKLLNYWDALKVRWHVVALAFIAALPELLNWLGGIDVKPILAYFGVSEGTAGLIVSALPFVLMFVKSATHLGDPEVTE